MPVWKEWGQGNPEALIFHFSTDGPSQLAAGPVAPRQLRCSDEICPSCQYLPVSLPRALPLRSPWPRLQHEPIPRSRDSFIWPHANPRGGLGMWCSALVLAQPALICSRGASIALCQAGRRHGSGERELPWGPWLRRGSIQPHRPPVFR